MLYNYYFDIAAIMLCSMLLFNIYVRRTYPSRTCTLYKQMLWLNLISSIFDTVTAVTISYPYSCPLAYNYIACGAYLFFHNLTSIVFFKYVLETVHGNGGNTVEKLFFKSAFAYEALIIITSPFTQLVYYFDENRNYCHGFLIYTLYIVSFAVLIYALVLFIRHRKTLNSYQMAINITFLTLLLGAVVFQFFCPSVLIESFCASIAFLMMNVGLDNPETYFYANTYCFNHTAFNERISEKIAAKDTFSIVGFTFPELSLLRKKYGETMHRKVMYAIIKQCREYSMQKSLYLLSGDLFAVCLEHGGSADDVVSRVSELMRRTLEADGRSMRVDPHFCVLTYPGDYHSVSDISDAVTSMLTDVYRNTGERVVYNCTDMLYSKHREEQVVHILNRALAEDGFEIRFQPIWDAHWKRFISAEALVRLKEELSEGIGPDVFIPVAEDNGIILRIGEIVFEKVCRFLSEHPPVSMGIDYVEVNLSKIQLLNNSAVRQLEHTAAKFGIPARYINFEITETVSLNSSERTQLAKNIRYLHDRGFTFSLDDYGSGFSDVSYIAESPFSLIKIDRDVLWNAMDNPRFKVVLEVSVSMIHGLGMKCVAEGVESHEMAALLDELGCDNHQGYLYAKPLTPEDMIAFCKLTEKIERAKIAEIEMEAD